MEDERRRWRAAVSTSVREVDQALQEYYHAQQQLRLADKRAGKARFVISKSGFRTVIRPRQRISYRNARILGSGSKQYYLFLL